MPTLAVSGLTVAYGSGGYVVRPLDNLSFDVADGELVVLLGPSGCGKTTLLSCLAGLLTPTSGSIRLDGKEVTGLAGRDLAAYRRADVGVVFQAFNLLPSLTARGNVVAPLRLAGVPRRAAHARAVELLQQVGLGERLDHRPRALSGGQQQRVAIARALVHDPKMVLADEPTAHLDHVQVEGVLQLMRRLAQPGRLLVVATHDDRVTHLADRVIELVARADSADRDPSEVTLAAGEALFRQGDRGDLVFVVERGEIELYRELAGGGEERLRIALPGEYFGELGPTLHLPRSASARAIGEAAVTGYTLRHFRRQYPGLARDLTEVS
ncbi:MAG TPA: ATP-binding cassette domain-containing protein [Acidimicrobiales bacterium]|nr:ATP-binding cassette domain-containing protein [Acidimicrobiales bacterium]